MKNKLSPEEKAERSLGSLDGIRSSDLPAGFEERMFARMDEEFFKVKAPKWFWVAAAVLLLINVSAAWKFSSSSSGEQTHNSIASYYFRGGTDWYNQ